MGRLNDTKALTQRPSDAGVEHTVRSQKIENGYLTSTSSYNPGTGECTEKRQFSKEPPRITPPVVEGSSAPGSVGSESLGDTMQYLGGKK